MPDISQVVPLANVFGVSTDVLFGMYGCNQAQDIDEKLSEIFRIYDASKDGEEGKTAAVILEKYRDLIRLYPNNSTIHNGRGVQRRRHIHNGTFQPLHPTSFRLHLTVDALVFV